VVEYQINIGAEPAPREQDNCFKHYICFYFSTIKIDMHTALYHLHYYNRYLILAALAFVLFRSISGWLGKRPYEKVDSAAGGALVGLAHLQLLVGLIQYFFTSAYTKAAFADMGAAMKDSTLRYFAVEHITTMLLAIVLIQLGRTFSKRKTDDTQKHKTVAIFTGAGALLIVVTLAMKGLLY
jgi:hypothetical protein